MAKRAKKGDWVVMSDVPGEVAHCTRCGEGLRLSLPQHMEVFIAAGNAFVKVHENCPPNEQIEQSEIQFQERA